MVFDALVWPAFQLPPCQQLKHGSVRSVALLIQCVELPELAHHKLSCVQDRPTQSTQRINRVVVASAPPFMLPAVSAMHRLVTPTCDREKLSLPDGASDQRLERPRPSRALPLARRCRLPHGLGVTVTRKVVAPTIHSPRLAGNRAGSPLARCGDAARLAACIHARCTASYSSM